MDKSDDYYDSLQKLDADLREYVLASLRDVAFDLQIWELHRHESVMNESLMRDITSSAVLAQFTRMAHGGARLTKFRFTFTAPEEESGGPPSKLSFAVSPDSNPPTNVHVIIGRNGVGKTYILHEIARTLTPSYWPEEILGTIEWAKFAPARGAFANLIGISFSAFDESGVIPDGAQNEEDIRYTFIGLRENNENLENFGQPKTPENMATEFLRSLKACNAANRRRRWDFAIAILGSDPVFRAERIDELLDICSSNASGANEVSNRFRRLSSGHKIVLLTITRLVEAVEEKTLLLVDEPECHLHPPLLSSFVRSVSELLIDRNGVAIVATHSPVVLQEVPSSCVWILSRYGRTTKAERPMVETFGENLSILSREVFQLELIQSGFHQLLERAAAENRTYEAALAEFDGELGSEAKAVLRAMCFQYSGE